MNNFTKRCVAAFASLAMAGTLCAAGAVTVSGVAWAGKPGIQQGGQSQGGVTGLGNPSQPVQKGDAPWELNDTDKAKTYSLTIFKWKYEVDSTTKKQKKSTPVPGAEFTVKKVTKIDGKDIDLTKYADWVKVANKIDYLNKNKATVATEDVANGAKDTDAKGVAKFDNLKIGLYQVQETTVPTGFSAAESKPFYMTIPRIEKDDKGNVVYNYAPYADPKNKDLSNSVKKTADTSKTVGAGDKISYTISADLDKMKEKAETGKTTADLSDDDFKGYSVVDLAPANAFTTYDASVVTKVTVGTDDTNKANTELKNEGSTKYYEVGTVTDVAAVTSGNNQDVARKKIPITFTEEGRKKLAEAANNKPGEVVKVFVTLEFTLADSTTLGNSTVANKGGLIPSHTTGNPDVVTGKKYEEVKFSKFTIQKLSAKDNSKVAGAKFKLFADKTNADNCSKAITSNQNVDTACSAYSTNFGEKDAKGTDAKTDEYSVVRGKKYYVVETVAPTGYIRNPDAVEVEVGDNDDIKNFEFKDVPDDSKGSWLSLLPKTGAAGVIIFAVIGMCFVGSGFFVYMRRRKKEEEQAKLRA
ncbi:SpaH/EbpB family LPXTG-anchored major pilin [Gardnerella vaginalis]|uniref:SpaH/EbpB family LPXTG-anchored major pilin n=1 Tax=Gardnerella vaginalis TaxID=2702 RepID=UPI0039F0F330